MCPGQVLPMMLRCITDILLKQKKPLLWNIILSVGTEKKIWILVKWQCHNRLSQGAYKQQPCLLEYCHCMTVWILLLIDLHVVCILLLICVVVDNQHSTTVFSQTIMQWKWRFVIDMLVMIACFQAAFSQNSEVIKAALCRGQSCGRGTNFVSCNLPLDFFYLAFFFLHVSVI